MALASERARSGCDNAKDKRQSKLIHGIRVIQHGVQNLENIWLFGEEEQGDI
jgi:hypothetical protein